MDAFGLLFFFSDEFDESDVVAMEEFVNSCPSHPSWPDVPVEFVDHVDDTELTNPEDVPVRTVGGFLSIPRAVDNKSDEQERKTLDQLIEALIRFTKTRSCEIELELDRELVGNIKNGVPSKSLLLGLLGMQHDE
ncbi:MAG: hypothetical protein KDA54_05270 [Phycisphaerales bacterium]|nr:hypothetical protein [Phycisphaerales bacterium]